jgi:ferrous iron transport protein A
MDTAVRSHAIDTTVPTALSNLRPGTTATIVAVGSATDGVSQMELRLLELGFIAGERVEIVAEARPGRDPFVVRVGTTQFALRRYEAQNIWVEDARPL